MIIAKQKRKENIIEYVLYIWQLEDLMRAFSFDSKTIDNYLTNQFDQTDEIKSQISAYYENLCQMMVNEKIQEKGHIQAISNIVAELTDLHLTLLKSPLHTDYLIEYNRTMPYIAEFFDKLKGTVKTEIDVCLNALYGFMLLKIQKKEISVDTERSIQQFSKLLALLAKKFFIHEKGELEF